ncbi:2-keto-4-pentenoate hydratase [compost metagenome]
MVPNSSREIALLLEQCSRSGRVIARLPDHLRLRTRLEAYAVQKALVDLSGRPSLGWKVAATSFAGQAHIGVEGPIAGRLLAGSILASGCTIDLTENRMRVAEPEFVFEFARAMTVRDLPWSIDEVLEHVSAAYPAIEIPDSRFDPFVSAGELQLIADNACAHVLIIGPPMPDNWSSDDFAAAQVVLETSDGKRSVGGGREVLGDPRVALTWLVNEITRHDMRIEKGDMVTTGACCAPLAISEGGGATATFGNSAHVSVTFR